MARESAKLTDISLSARHLRGIAGFTANSIESARYLRGIAGFTANSIESARHLRGIAGFTAKFPLSDLARASAKLTGASQLTYQRLRTLETLKDDYEFGELQHTTSAPITAEAGPSSVIIDESGGETALVRLWSAIEELRRDVEIGRSMAEPSFEDMAQRQLKRQQNPWIVWLSTPPSPNDLLQFVIGWESAPHNPVVILFGMFLLLKLINSLSERWPYIGHIHVGILLAVIVGGAVASMRQ